MPLSDADKIINLEDLAAFKAKMDESVLHKVGTETVTGEKVFSGIQTTVSGNESALMVVKDPSLVKGETPEITHYLSLGFIDSTGNSYAQDDASRLGVFEYKSPSVSSPSGFVQMAARNFYGGSEVAVIQVGYDADGIMFSRAPATSNERTASTDIITRGYLAASEWNWQKTLKAESVTFTPVPESDLEPVVDFIFTETPPAEGEKGPDNPSTIAGVSSITVTRCRYVGVASSSYVIPLEDTYYGGSLDVASGVMTVTHNYISNVAGGTTSFGIEGDYAKCLIQTSEAVKNDNLSLVCNRFATGESSGERVYCRDSDIYWSVNCIILKSRLDFSSAADPSNPTDAEVAEAFSSWLASNPTSIVFARKVPVTVQLTPVQIKSLVAADKYTPRPNMVYSDQQAVQVGYQRFYDENRLAALEARIAALEGS